MCELKEVQAVGIPGEIDKVTVEVFGCNKEVSRAATISDLRRLCEANGIGTLPAGKFMCSECGGVRATGIACQFCTLQFKIQELEEASSLRAKPRGQLNPQPICEVHGRILELEEKLARIQGIATEK